MADQTVNNDTLLTLPKNITIRRYRATDSPSLSHHGNNANIYANLRNRMPHPYTEADALSWATLQTDATKFPRSGPWDPKTGSQGPPLPTNYAICIDGEACGSIGLDFGDPKDIYARCAEVGYWLSEEHWGKGIMSIVVPAFVDWSWRTWGILIRLNAEVTAKNWGSRKCLEKAGFKCEAIFKWYTIKNGVLCDSAMMGMLRPGAEAEAEVE